MKTLLRAIIVNLIVNIGNSIPMTRNTLRDALLKAITVEHLTEIRME
jgi:hypothetical protein